MDTIAQGIDARAIVNTDKQLEIAVAGARVIIPAAAIADLWLERARLKLSPTPALFTGIPRIGAPVGGGTFMGIVRGEDSADYLLFDHGEAPERMNFEAATKWAEERGGSLPTRREQALMFANRGEDQYRKEWYWSREPYAGSAEFAWMQLFELGGQDGGRKSLAYRARVVRRQPIQ